MSIREMRVQLGETQSGFAARYSIPFRTIQNWEAGIRRPPEYIKNLLSERIKSDLINRKTNVLPTFDPRKENLPKRNEYVGAFSWLKAVAEHMGEDCVFALDEALICQGDFGGRSDEFLIWAYGNETLKRFNGVAILGNSISPFDVQERNGIKYTTFNRTLNDSFANEQILDMQGITEALSRYYYSNGESFDGIFVAPEYQDRFEELSRDAIEYYDE